MKNEEAYQIGPFTPGADDFPPRWEADAREFRELEAALGRARLNEPYGPHPREAYDLFHPAGPAAGLVVFVHGGYWVEYDRSYWSHFAAGATARGYCVAMPSYPLAPEATIDEIIASVCRAIEAAADRVQGPIYLAGHSAGGHLVAASVTQSSPLSAAVRARIRRALPISPVTDLRPLLETSRREDLHLTPANAPAVSPALMPEPHGIDVIVWVGSEERPAFLDQARWLADAWPNAQHHIAAGRNHFDVIDPLRDAESTMISALLD